MTRWSVRQAPVPATVEDPAAWAVHGACRAHAAVHRDLFGHADAAWRPTEVAAMLGERPYERTVLLVAVRAEAAGDADAVVGAALVQVPTQDNPHLAFAEPWVDPRGRGQGAGDALVAAVEGVARAEGRRTVILMSTHREPGPGVAEHAARSGAGGVPAADAGTRLAAGRGYGLEQVERFSTFALPLDGAAAAAVRSAYGAAARAAGPDYELVAWTGPTPDALLDQMAVLRTRMSTDVPTADLAVEEEPWDAARVRAHDAEVAEEGRVQAVVAARHRPTGALVAFTVVEQPVAVPEVAYQQDTLVVQGHRGHRLGMLVKTAQLLRLGDAFPGLRRLHTWNAQENAHMLAINVELGFTPTGVLGMWQRDPPDPAGADGADGGPSDRRAEGDGSARADGDPLGE
ncbi:GNAT family N-acetyltransferase [Cellulomonas fimi]|uniref:GCN5-related N-acetyltransferase n=1 Tax=Cellulomonas fimi (strain ATCC 484 / DSM 20113 / JCM 1341 / CCUG 24087 / LMG 16345 / NBRC 15513 / NCIMB 8980 / NCTC 7547 / NRS-133) TaxID=590998 RepID=F4H2U7_CELFA|nr:GNAT family N-acetyltransferase [Cellulomonas fimi]AEE46446.1 GCN5-related N-acetyltransferase [Cellulomonas fimi ATCC 484]NNH07738.1 GNAT family N-acetyltransferase [Cellulomonas fimi]VEH33035.1 Uncharacterised protein [Cellulomonas fimi]